MSLRLTPDGTFIRKVEFIIINPAGTDFNDLTNQIKAIILKGIESIAQFFTQRRINNFEVLVHNTAPEIPCLMLSETELTAIDFSKTKILVPDQWNPLFSETTFSDIKDESMGFVYAINQSMSIHYGFKVEIEFKNMLGSLDRIDTPSNDRKFAAMFQKNNMLQALIEKERMDNQEKLKKHKNHIEIKEPKEENDTEIMLQKLEKHDKVKKKQKNKEVKEIKFY